ncbi:hypothetical protein AA106_17725 [Photorhabdus laumondii subsp. laumondii]|nr:hypothetical protein AA106_19730 [Photorhabdus laumondii subsp. laumondii]KTL63265.1 hypothetical protein AA106_17725 [Photorhabdus laumondii subsp. laumondii]
MKIFTTDDFADFMDNNSLTQDIPNKLLKVYNLLAKKFVNINNSNLEDNLYPMDFKMHRGGKGANPREHR